MALARPGRPQRWVVAVLAVTLVMMTAVVVLVSLRQATLVRETAAAGARATTFQRIGNLSAYESAELQHALVEPQSSHGESAREYASQVLTGLARLSRTDRRHSEYHQTVHREQAFLLPKINRFVDLVSNGRTDAAYTLLQQEIEPTADRVRDTLEDDQATHVAEYQAYLAQATRESGELVIVTVLAFVLGLGVLGVLWWSGRSYRQVIERMAAEDSLTGLPNRASFRAHAEAAFSVSPAGRHPTLLMLDLDGFKHVNDTLGHEVGDLMLVEVGHRLRECVREGDIVARLGGDEFAVLLADAGPRAGEATANRITEVMAEPFVVGGVTLPIDISVGIATAKNGEGVSAVLRQADIAMYVAKRRQEPHIRFDPEHATAPPA